MSTFEFQELLKSGFSEAFLRTPQGSHGKLRRHYLRGVTQSKKCRHCGELYALAREITVPVLNAADFDLRLMFDGAAQDRGYCSSKCEFNAKSMQNHSLFGNE